MTALNGHTEPFAKVSRRLISEQLWRFSKTDILVHLFIMSYADKHSGEAFPGSATIAEGVHCSRESVSRSTTRLKAVGLLGKEPRRTGRGGWPGTLYTIAAEPIADPGICDETVNHVCDETVNQYVTKPSPDLDHRSDHKIRRGAAALAREPRLDKSTEEQVDDQSARRQAACTVEEWLPTEQDYQLYLDQGAADGWLTGVGAIADTHTAANREFAKFREWAADLEPRSPAKWHATWRSWLTRTARHGERRGRRSGRRSVFDLARGAVTRPGAGAPAQDG
jgi:hypothetical protein